MEDTENINETEEVSLTEESINLGQDLNGNDEDMIDENERDPEMEDFAQKFRTIYENQFRDYLKTLTNNSTLSATSLPTKKYNKDTYEMDSMNSTSLIFYFDHLESDESGNINAIVATSFDKSQSCHFQPFICKDYGPYYRTTLYTSYYNIGRGKNPEAEHFFLDLPIDLYNLIDMD